MENDEDFVAMCYMYAFTWFNNQLMPSGSDDCIRSEIVDAFPRFISESESDYYYRGWSRSDVISATMNEGNPSYLAMIEVFPHLIE